MYARSYPYTPSSTKIPIFFVIIERTSIMKKVAIAIFPMTPLGYKYF